VLPNYNCSLLTHRFSVIGDVLYVPRTTGSRITRLIRPTSISVFTKQPAQLVAFLSLITRGVFRGALAPALSPVLQPSLIFDGGIFAVLLHFFFKNIKIWAFVNIKASAF